MIGKKTKKRKKEIDKQLLEEIFRLKNEWTNLKSIMDRSFDTTERGRQELSVIEAKYFYLLREARHRKISVLQ